MADSILVFGEPTESGPAQLTLGSHRVSVEALRANMKAILGEMGEILGSARDFVGGARVAHVDMQLAVGVDGSIGLLGTGASSSIKGTLTVRLEFAD